MAGPPCKPTCYYPEAVGEAGGVYCIGEADVDLPEAIGEAGGVYCLGEADVDPEPNTLVYPSMYCLYLKSFMPISPPIPLN